MRKFTVDTNLYVRAARNHADAEPLKRFYGAFAPHLHLCSVVLHELLVGAQNDEMARRIHEEIARPFDRTGRIIPPSHRSWIVAGESLAKLAAAGYVDRSALPRSFINDVLLASCCREAGVTLVTDNTRDFERIKSVLPFDFVAPWPGPGD